MMKNGGDPMTNETKIMLLLDRLHEKQDAITEEANKHLKEGDFQIIYWAVEEKGKAEAEFIKAVENLYRKGVSG